MLFDLGDELACLVNDNDPVPELPGAVPAKMYILRREQVSSRTLF